MSLSRSVWYGIPNPRRPLPKQIQWCPLCNSLTERSPHSCHSEPAWNFPVYNASLLPCLCRHAKTSTGRTRRRTQSCWKSRRGCRETQRGSWQNKIVHMKTGLFTIWTTIAIWKRFKTRWNSLVRSERRILGNMIGQKHTLMSGFANCRAPMSPLRQNPIVKALQSLWILVPKSVSRKVLLIQSSSLSCPYGRRKRKVLVLGGLGLRPDHNF